MGSCWPSEMEALAENGMQNDILEGRQLVVLAFLHKLSKESLQELEKTYNGFCGELEHYAPMTFVDIRSGI